MAAVHVPCTAGGGPEQNPVLIAQPYTCRFKPFDMDKPLLNEIAEETYKSYPRPCPQRGLVVAAGALHGVTMGQVFGVAMLDNCHEELCKAVVTAVQDAQSTLTPVGDTSGLQPHTSYHIIETWDVDPTVALHTSGNGTEGHDSDLPLTAVMERSIAVSLCSDAVQPNPRARCPTLLNQSQLKVCRSGISWRWFRIVRGIQTTQTTPLRPLTRPLNCSAEHRTQVHMAVAMSMQPCGGRGIFI